MSDLSDEARALIARARTAHDPSSDDEERVLSSVLARVVPTALATAVAMKTASAATSAGASTSTSAAAGAVFGSVMVKTVLVSVALLGTVAGGVALVARAPREAVDTRRAPLRAPVARPLPSVREPTARVAPGQPPPVEMVPAALPAHSTSRSPAHRSARAPTAAPAPSLEQEAELLGSVHDALRQDDPQRALAILDGQPTSGALAEERAASRILALCRLGRGEEARIAGERFFATWPSSSMAAAVRDACRDGR